MLRVIFSICFFSLLVQANASELRGPEAGVIPYGMGRAYSAVADDGLALFYNPAGLAQVRAVDFQVFDLKLGANSQVISSSSQVRSVSDSSTTSIEKANKLVGKTVNAQVNNTTQMTIPNFSMAAVYDIQIGADLQNKQYPTTDIRYVKDFDIVAGTGWGFGNRKEFRVGLTLDFASRKGGSTTVDISELNSSASSLLDRFNATGSAVGITTGMQYTFNLKNRTEINTSFVWHDMGNTNFGASNLASRPDSRLQNMVAGAEVRLPIGGKVNRRKARRYGEGRSPHHLSFAFDYSQLNYSQNKLQLPMRFHYGINLDLPIFSIQVGANQNALCFGTSIDLLGLKVSAASYNEELGSYAGQKRDHRYLISIGGSLGIGKF